MISVRVRAVAAAASLLIVVAVPAASVAAPRPPANPEVNQYFEDLPQAGGDEGIVQREGGGAVSGATVNELDALGGEGQAAARLAQATEPRRVKPSPGALDVRAGEEGGSAAGGLLDALTDSVPLAILLVATLALGIAAWLNRRRLGS